MLSTWKSLSTLGAGLAVGIANAIIVIQPRAWYSSRYIFQMLSLVTFTGNVFMPVEQLAATDGTKACIFQDDWCR